MFDFVSQHRMTRKKISFAMFAVIMLATSILRLLIPAGTAHRAIGYSGLALMILCAVLLWSFRHDPPE